MRVPPPRRAYVVCQLLGWTALGALGFALYKAMQRITPGLVASNAIATAGGLLLSHGLRHVILANGWLSRRPRELLPRLLAGAVIAGVANELLITLTGYFVLRVFTPGPSTPVVLAVTTSNWIITFLLWVALYAGAHYLEHARRARIRELELEVSARESQLDALRAQINPHVLFNALNSLRALIDENPERARDAVTRLSSLLRYALQAGKRERVTLAEELDIVRDYLGLESIRYEERLRWRIDVAAGLESARVPPMLVQTLVENAVKHGVAESARGGEVAIRVVADAGMLRIDVTNPGCVTEDAGDGVGLANARHRLQLLFGDRGGLRLAGANGDVVATATLPLEPS